MNVNRIIIRVLQGTSTLLALVLVLFLAAIAEKFHAQWDWTSNKHNSLSPRSAQILSLLDGPLEVIVAHTQRMEDAGVKPRLEKIVSFYEKVKPDLQVQYLNTTINPQMAQDMGISQEIEIRLNFQGRSRTVTEASENEISNALLRLMLDEQAKIHWVDYGRLQARIGDAGPNGLKTFADAIQEDAIELEALSLASQPELDSDSTQMLIVAPPPVALLDKEIELIDGYIQSGVNALIMVDPGAAGGLESLLLDYGIELRPGTVLDNIGGLFFGSRQFTFIQEFPAHPVLDRLGRGLVFPLAGALDYASLSDADGWQRKYLLNVGSNAWYQPFEPTPQDGGQTAQARPAVALVMTRELSTAEFADADGAEDSDSADGAADEDAEAAAAREEFNKMLGELENEQRVVIVADSDFLKNQYIGSLGNLDFARDAVNWLASNDQLLTITREQAGDRELNLDEDELSWLFYFWGIFVPLSFLAIAIGVGLYRRRLR